MKGTVNYMKVIKAERLLRRECLETLKEYRATEIESYVLISNWGYTFKINDVKYDARFLENMYSFSPTKWSVFNCEGARDTLAKEIENKLNR